MEHYTLHVGELVDKVASMSSNIQLNVNFLGSTFTINSS